MTTDHPGTTDDPTTTAAPTTVAGSSSTTSPYNNIDPYQLLQGTWVSSNGTFMFTPTGDGVTLTTQFGGSGNPGRELTTFMDVNAGSGELDVSYDFASNPNQITVDEDQMEYVATRQ